MRYTDSRSTSWFVASIGSGLMPSARANTLAEPPGTTPTAGAGPPGPASPRIPLTTSFTVPSPPCTISTSTPVTCRVTGDLDGMAAVVGVRDRQLHAALQRVGEQVAPRRGGRRRVGVHDQHGAHGVRAYPPDRPARGQLSARPHRSSTTRTPRPRGFAAQSVPATAGRPDVRASQPLPDSVETSGGPWRPELP